MESTAVSRPRVDVKSRQLEPISLTEWKFHPFLLQTKTVNFVHKIKLCDYNLNFLIKNMDLKGIRVTNEDPSFSVLSSKIIGLSDTPLRSAVRLRGKTLE